MPPKRRVAPFGNPRINACSQLPEAYRSVLRPSSPLGAKASTRCPYLLDRPRAVSNAHRTLKSAKTPELGQPLQHPGAGRSVRARAFSRFNEPLGLFATPAPLGGGDRTRTDDPLLAKQVLSRLSYTPARRRRAGPRSVVGLGRFELPTSRLSGVRSNRLSYRPPERRTPPHVSPGRSPPRSAPRTRGGLSVAS